MASKAPPTPDSAAMRSDLARVAALARHARYPGEKMTAARAKLLDKFRDAVDPDRQLAQDERERRAIRLRRAWLTRVAYYQGRARNGHQVERLTLDEWLEQLAERETSR